MVVAILIGIFVAIIITNFKVIGTERINLTEGVLQRFERTGNLQVITFYMDQIIDEEIKRSLFTIDELFPDTKVLFSVKTEVSACIDLTKVTKDNIDDKGTEVIVTLPKPEFCSDPVIDFETLTKHFEWGFNTSDLQIEALKHSKDTAKQQAIDNQIFELAQDQGEVIISGLLTELSEKNIVVIFD